jgi:hypothetical protein
MMDITLHCTILHVVNITISFSIDRLSLTPGFGSLYVYVFNIITANPLSNQNETDEELHLHVCILSEKESVMLFFKMHI